MKPPYIPKRLSVIEALGIMLDISPQLQPFGLDRILLVIDNKIRLYLDKLIVDIFTNGPLSNQADSLKSSLETCADRYIKKEHSDEIIKSLKELLTPLDKTEEYIEKLNRIKEKLVLLHSQHQTTIELMAIIKADLTNSERILEVVSWGGERDKYVDTVITGESFNTWMKKNGIQIFPPTNLKSNFADDNNAGPLLHQLARLEHTTPLINLIDELIAKFWVNHDPDKPPTKSLIRQHIVTNYGDWKRSSVKHPRGCTIPGLSSTTFNAICSIMRPPDYKDIGK